MGGTHKKKLRAEKAKVKLKGAKLPKGLNVTKTEFKVRKIVIRDQLKEAQYIEGLRQIPLKETLNRLKHHSSSFRLEALRNLREAILAGHPGVGSQLNEIIQGISAVGLDLDKDTRRESYKTLSQLLGNLSEDSVAPFFHIVSSYLRCAMTHIQPALQEDSLLLLDCLLQHVPHLVAMHHEKIFQNFLEMISRVRSEGDRSGRTLTVNMGKQQTTVKWRSKVLLRLQQMLKTLVEHKRINNSTSATKNRNFKIVTFSNKAPQHYSLKRPFPGQSSCDLSFIFSRSAALATNTLNTTKSIATATADESSVLRNYIEHLLPLLLEAWLEVRPSHLSSHSKQVVLNQDAAITLKIVLEIIENLWSLIEIHESEVNTDDLSTWFRREYGERFGTNFVQYGFPYQQLEQQKDVKDTSKRGKKTPALDTGGECCVTQNLSVAHLMCRFYTDRNGIHEESEKFLTLLRYLNALVTGVRSADSDNYRNLDGAIRAYLLLNGLALLELHGQEMRSLLRSIIVAFLNNQFPSRDGISAKILVILCEIVQEPELFTAFGADKFNDFLRYLPQLLLKPSISETALLSMTNLSKQKNATFLGALSEVIHPVVESIQKIQVTGASNAFEGKKYIMNLFYWLNRDEWSDTQREELAQKIQQHINDKRIASYFHFVLVKS